ncbi:hypothetical protein ACQI5H_23770 [Mycobacterium heidelbergense]|uniref:hypothetical protein n=1 Tax=Mycobacterium heidelbergense TaxID=53376 RepID=UPI003CF7DC24
MGWLLPVGIPGGVNSGLDGIPDGSGIIRSGDKLIHLDLSLYRLWRTAAAAPQAGELISWATAHGITNAAEGIQALADAELLLEEGPEIEQRVGRLSLRLLGECVGNGTEVSPMFLVLGRNNARLHVDACLFRILILCDRLRPISIVCEAVDASRPRDGAPCIEALTARLPMLVRNEVIQLEATVR